MDLERLTHGRHGLVVGSSLLATLILVTASVASSTLAASAGTLRSSALVAGGTTSLLVPGIAGSGTLKGPSYIDVLSWSWGVNNIAVQPTSAGAGRSGKVDMRDITVMKVADSVSPLLFKNCVAGTHFKSVVLYMDPPPSSAGATSGDSMTVTMSNVRISGDTLSSGGDRFTESVSFNFTKVQMDYFPQGRVKVHFYWDRTSGKSA